MVSEIQHRRGRYRNHTLTPRSALWQSGYYFAPLETTGFQTQCELSKLIELLRRYSTDVCHAEGKNWARLHVLRPPLTLHPCEKVIGVFFQNQFWSRSLDINILCLVCIKRSIDAVKTCQISKRGYQQGPSDEKFKKGRCKFCGDKLGHRIMEAVGFFDNKMHNCTKIAFNFTNRWSNGIVSWFSDIILHRWYFRKLYTIK